MKLALNGIVASTNEAVSEALVIAERSGIERDAAYKAITASVVGSPFVAYKQEAYLAPGSEPAASSVNGSSPTQESR